MNIFSKQSPKATCLASLLLFFITSFLPAFSQEAGLDLLLSAGELSSEGIILQCRFNQGSDLIEDDLVGMPGEGRFEIAPDSAFTSFTQYQWLEATAPQNYIICQRIQDLVPNTRYYYRVAAISDKQKDTIYSKTATFKTFSAPNDTTSVTFAMSTGFNYEKFYGLGRAANGGRGKIMAAPAQGVDLKLGFEAFAAVKELNPDFFIANGDVVYYDSPTEKPELRALTAAQMRAKWHRYFSMPRNRQMMRQVPVYYLKDDHDHRFNDSDTTDAIHKLPTHEDGIRVFQETVPVVAPEDENPLTYRTYQAGKLLQLWIVEGRDYRSPNRMEDGPQKTIWGKTQKEWLKRTLSESEAVFKILVSPTPMIGPDDAYKIDNHANPGGFQHEKEEFIDWLNENDFQDKNFYIICGDRHWQYHSIHPDGYEEFSCGAFVDQNSRPGRLPGDPKSSDPEALLKVPYIQTKGKNSGGFLKVSIQPHQDGPQVVFSFHDTHGKALYSVTKSARTP